MIDAVCAKSLCFCGKIHEAHGNAHIVFLGHQLDAHRLGGRILRQIFNGAAQDMRCGERSNGLGYFVTRGKNGVEPAVHAGVLVIRLHFLLFSFFERPSCGRRSVGLNSVYYCAKYAKL